MTKSEAISQCRAAFDADEPRWPGPLIAAFDGPGWEGRVFAWLISCVGDLLHHFGVGTERLSGSLDMARRAAEGRLEVEPVEIRAGELWLASRPTLDPATLATAQLLFVFLLCRKDGVVHPAGSAKPIVILDRLSTHRGETLDRVISHFERHAEIGPPGSDS